MTVAEASRTSTDRHLQTRTDAAEPETAAVQTDLVATGADAAPVPAGREDAELDVGYQVRLDGFAGPLDLLLYLVRRAEVDITDIPIVEIADQFIATVTAWEELDLDVAGDFILMASTLLEMKARIVMPPDEDEEGEDDDEEFIDPRADLIHQLLAYRKVKEAVLELEDLESTRQHCHFRRVAEDIPEDPEEADGVDLDNADPFQLFLVWEEVLASISAQAPRTVTYNDVPIEERMRQIERMMAEAGEAKLAWFLERVDSSVQRCGVVVALLESVRKRFVEVSQYEQFGDVHMRYVEPDARERSALPPVVEVEEPAATGKRRRRKRPPLFTYDQASVGADGEQEVLPQVEDELVVETDEQRFLNELNAEFGIDGLIKRIRHLDVHLRDHLLEQGVDLPEGEFDHLEPETNGQDGDPVASVEAPAAAAAGVAADGLAASAAPADDEEAADDDADWDEAEDDYDDDDDFEDDEDDDDLAAEADDEVR